MDKQKLKSIRRSRRHAGIRKRVCGTPSRPRLCVYKSLNHFYAQVIDDIEGKTLVAASSREKGVSASSTGGAEAAAAVGASLAQRAKESGVTEVAFDRAGFRFHGRVKAFADAARKGGLKF